MRVVVMSRNAENSGAVSDSVRRTVHHSRRVLSDVLHEDTAIDTTSSRSEHSPSTYQRTFKPLTRRNSCY